MRARNRNVVSRSVRPVIEALEQRRLMSMGPVLAITNLDGLPTDTRLVFNKIENPNPVIGDTVHDTSSLRLSNTGDATLTIDSLQISGPWTILNQPADGSTIAAGTFMDITLQFTQQTLPAHAVNQTNNSTDPNGGAVVDGSLTITTDDPAHARESVSLAGYWQDQSEHSNEPNLTTITNLLFDYGTTISNPYRVDLTESGPSPTLYGDEVASALWVPADPAQPVAIREIASFRTQGNTVHTYWDPAGSTNAHLLLTTIPDEGQTLLPHAPGTTNPLETTFSPGGAFGLQVDDEFSDDTLNPNQSTSGGGHHMRFYPLKDASGNVVPNTWLVAMDYSVIQAENFDFNDNVFIISNMHPATVPPSPTNLTATNGASITLDWTAVTYPTLAGYNVYRSTSIDGPFTLLTTGAPISPTEYIDSTGSASTTYFYQVTAVDSISSFESIPATVSATTNPTPPTSPVANNDTFDVTAGILSTEDVLANDAATAANTSIDPTTALIVAAPTHGSASFDLVTGILSYTPSGSFHGTDTLTYTVEDSNAVTSNVATVTFNVVGGGSTSTPTANDDSAETTFNTLVAVNVLGNDIDNGATLDPTTVAIATAPTHGTTSIDPQTGVISYTPSSNFVGSDSLTYTVADSGGQTSAPATLSLNVGVTFQAGKFLRFTDARHVLSTFIIGGHGTGVAYFSGNGTVTFSHSRPTVSGTALAVANIALANTTVGSAMVIRNTGGVKKITVGGLSDASPMGLIIAPAVDLVGSNPNVDIQNGANIAGSLNLAGARLLQLKSASNLQMTIGSSLTTPLNILLGTVTNSVLSSAQPIGVLRATNWTKTTFGLSVAAPSLRVLLVNGNFDPDLSLTGKLTVARVVGQVGQALWSIGGKTTVINVGSIASGWNGAFSDNLNVMLVHSGGLPSDVQATNINVLNLLGNLTGDVTASSINVLRVTGNVSSSTVQVTGVGTPLKTLLVLGNITSSHISSAGDIQAVIASSLVNSLITAGNVTASDVPSADASTIGAAKIHAINLTGHNAAFAFSNSNILADSIGTALLGTVQTDNSGTPDGLATQSISVLNATFGAIPIHAGPNQLTDQATLDSYLTGKGVTLQDFVINLIP